MSLIIAKVNRKERTQSLYSDGISVFNDEIVHNRMKKINHFTHKNTAVSFGGTGASYFLTYVMDNFEKFFTEYVNENKPTGKQTEYYRKNLPIIFNRMADEYVSEMNISDDDDELKCSNGYIVVIDGEIYRVSKYGDERFRCSYKDGFDALACGVGEESANCLMDVDIPIERVFEIISKHYATVNNTVFKDENLCYF